MDNKSQVESTLLPSVAGVSLVRMCVQLLILVIVFLLPAELLYLFLGPKDNLYPVFFRWFPLANAALGGLTLLLTFAFRPALRPVEQVFGVLTGFMSVLSPLILYLAWLIFLFDL